MRLAGYGAKAVAKKPLQPNRWTHVVVSYDGDAAGVIAVGLPLAWLWMLLDALLREERRYPGGTAASNNRLLWVLLILFVHVTAVLYFVMVYRPMRAADATALPAAA